MTIINPWKSFPEEIGWSLLIALTTATLTVFIAAPLAWQATGGKSKTKILPALMVTGLLLALPGPIVSLAVIWSLSQPGIPWAGWLYDHTILAPVLVTTARALPLSLLVCWYALRAISQDVLDSAATEGASYWARFFFIALPQRYSALGAAWLTALAVAMGDLSATANILVMPPGIDTIVRRIFGLIHFGVIDQVAGVSLALCVAFVAIAGGVIKLIRISWRRN